MLSPLLSQSQVANVELLRADPNSQILRERHLDIAHPSTSGPRYQMGLSNTTVVLLGYNTTSVDLTIDILIKYCSPLAIDETALPKVDPTLDTPALPQRLRYSWGEISN